MHTSMTSIKQTGRAALLARARSLRWYPYKKTDPIIQRALEIMPTSDLIYAAYISHRHRYLYINNPKTGGSSLKSALVQLELKNLESDLDYYDWQVYQNKLIIPLSTLNDLRHPTNFGSLLNNGYRFITFVRNPYTRLLSCYRDKILKKRAEKGKILQFLGCDPSDMEAQITFEEFAKAVISQSDYDMDHHWRTQSTQVLYGLLPYSFIGRFENYDKDFSEAFRIIGVNEDSAPELRHFNRTKSGPAEGCTDYYNPTLQAMVYDRYKADFTNFGYSYDLPA